MSEYTACPSQEAQAPNGHATWSNTSLDADSQKPGRPPSYVASGCTLGECPTRRKSWRIPVAIAGFYFLALLCAVVHYVFFRYLDNRVISQGIPLSAKTTSIPQAYVTTISLLLVTAFRAALLASVGTCYTQLLWATFRERVLKIKLIEDLFQVQTNVFRLGNCNLYLKTPIVAVVAVFSWLVPIATVYPPGALVVGLQTSTIGASFNVSVFHAKSFEDIVDERNIARIFCDYGSATTSPTSPTDRQNASFLETCYLTNIANERVKYVTRSNLMAGEMASFSQPSEGNSSYNLTFWGATLDCQTNNRTIERTFFNSDVEEGSEYAWVIPRFATFCELASSTDPAYVSEDLFVLARDTILTFSDADATISSYQYYPCLGGADGNQMPNTSSIPTITIPESGINVLVPITETVCLPKIAKYEVAISHVGGRQQVSYSIHADTSIPASSPIFRQFDGDFDQWMQFSDAMIIYENFVDNLNKSYRSTTRSYFTYPGPSESGTAYPTRNNTVVAGCLLNQTMAALNDEKTAGLEIWPLSVFQRRLGGPGSSSCPSFDADMARELLANTTVSALSLSAVFDNLDGTESRTFNVYRFRNKLVFFLPYGLSLALALPVVALAFHALFVRNLGVSAITGGFLQLLMTTTARVSLDAVLAKGSGTLGGYENVSDELREMEVRFGELVEIDAAEKLLRSESRSSGVTRHEAERENGGLGVASGAELCYEEAAVLRRAGFGTVQETRPFKKGLMS